jgi:hypothetical protein
VNIQDLIQKRDALQDQLDECPFTEEGESIANSIEYHNDLIRNHPDYKTTREYEQEINVQTNGHIW